MRKTGTATVKSRHPALSLRLGGRKACLGGIYFFWSDAIEKLFCHCPSFSGSITRDDMEPNTMFRATGVLAGQSVDPVELFGDGWGRLTPGQVSIGKARGNIAGRLRRTTKAERRDDHRRVGPPRS